MNRSSKDLHDTPQATADKENMAPSSPAKVPLETPIWAQYAMEKAAVEEPSKRLSVISIQGRSRTLEEEIALYTPENYSPSKQRNFQGYQPTLSRPTSSARPKSFIDVLGRKLSGERSRPTSRGSDELKLEKRDSKEGCRRSSGGGQSAENRGMFGRKVSSSSTEQPPPKPDLRVTKRGNRVMAAVAAINTKVNGPTMLTAESQLDPKEVDAAFEAVLEARNVPENMRQKMRTLTLRVKADFIKQDKGSQATPIPANKRDSKCSNWSHSSEENSVPQSSQNGSAAKVDENAKEDKPARPRSKTFSSSKTFTFSKGDKSGKGESSPKKQKVSIHGIPKRQRAQLIQPQGTKSGIPDDFVNYLRAVPDPTKVEVGRLHKLRLLLRNETVAWVDSFISLGA
ncbi:hypothetical protein H2203_001633 [Taxawa tesnikishii (nom. ined.)]|nr:hypothetical protein H2203_001633 [Dothideales sp. JES 119]